MHCKQDILDFIEGTAVVDSDGNPIVLHHGTLEDFSAFKTTRDIGYHFGTVRQADEREVEVRKRIRRKTNKKTDSREWNRLAAVIAIRNPFRLTEDPRAWPSDYVTRLCASALTQDHLKRMSEVNEECLAAARAESAAIGNKSDDIWFGI